MEFYGTHQNRVKNGHKLVTALVKFPSSLEIANYPEVQTDFSLEKSTFSVTCSGVAWYC
jgi:hypothetical protein